MPRRLTCLLLLLFATIAQAAPTTRPAVAPPKPIEGVDTHLDIEYAKPDGRPQMLDLYVPADAKGKLPLVVAIHGGGWAGGDKRHVPVIPLATRGYIVASINYRFSNEAIFPAQIHDSKAAIRWLRAHADEYHIDPDRIGVWGDSAGGHLVALLGTSGGNKELEGEEGNPTFSSSVQCVCDFYGPTDFLTINAQVGETDQVRPDAPNSLVSKLLGGPAPDNKEKAKLASPITFVSKSAPPFLILHGDKDPLVPLAQSEELRDALQKAGVEVELDVIKGAGHGFPRHPEINEKVQGFFDKHLKGNGA